MEKHSRIFVAGHRGLAGSAIYRQLLAAGYHNILTGSRADFDLIDQAATRRFFENENPEYVFLAAARVGGIFANNSYPAEFIQQNLAIQTNVIHEAHRVGVKRLLFLGSSCIYPRDCPQPIKEEYLLTGPLEPTNRPYALAKIAGIEMCWSYNRQYRSKFLVAMPTNLYGLGDNYDPTSSHVLPAMIRKMHEAKEGGEPEIQVWGTGRPRRELMYSDDLGDASVFLMQLPEDRFAELTDASTLPLINVGCGRDVTIRELADQVAASVGFSGRLVFDTTRPDGTPQKLLDSTRMKKLGWAPRHDMQSGIAAAYADFRTRILQSA